MVYTIRTTDGYGGVSGRVRDKRVPLRLVGHRSIIVPFVLPSEPRNLQKVLQSSITLIPNQLGQSRWSGMVCARCDGSTQLFGYDASLLACAIAFGPVSVRKAQI